MDLIKSNHRYVVIVKWQKLIRVDSFSKRFFFEWLLIYEKLKQSNLYIKRQWGDIVLKSNVINQDIREIKIISSDHLLNFYWLNPIQQ